ncbi:MAG: FHA domain-containing protein, partial [Kiritimatiellae bacterium]|nr:FHA domain-containing protein [Kiritimatiellia bacterium]
MKIRFKTGSLTGKAYQVKDGVVLVGRSHVCTVRIPGKEFPSVSKQHLLLMLTPEGMSLTNNSSHSDTTFVDGLPIPPGHKTFISDGSVVRIGRQGADVEFKVEGDEGMKSSGLEVETGGGCATGTVGAVTAQATRGSMTKITSGGTVGTAMPGFQPTGLPTAGTRLPAENAAAGFQPTGALTAGTCFPSGLQSQLKGNANQESDVTADPGTRTNHGNDEKTRNPDGTIPVDPEDIKILIQEAIRRRKAKSMMRFGLVIGILCLAAMTYYLMRPRPESMLTWPRDANGRFACYTQSLVVPAAT